MVIIGLTGSIGMGKTTAAGQLRRLGIPVYDADAGVHALMAKGGDAVRAVAEEFPEAVIGGAVDRRVLGDIVFEDGCALRRLESILHPLVRLAETRFLGRAARQRRALVVLDIPLLFETGGERRVDATIVVSAPAFIQAQRVLRRPGMSRARFDSICRKQMPDVEKRRCADFVIHTGLGKDQSLRELKAAVTVLAGTTGRNWPPRPLIRL